ncbi:MAG TPA: CDP-alcohol phosphatidyltransferase family protein [Actinomycetota bacterium]|nr:CDP-alcohol phosphatidyltransferase family protein [Actinomycetota bacterium]
MDDLDGAASAAASERLLTIPNVLSVIRLASVPVFLWLFVSGRHNAAVILYGTAASTDFLDGLIARRFGQVSEAGKLLDPLSDRVLILALTLALVARKILPWWLAAIVIARDLIVLSVFPALERRGVPRIPVNYVGKVATGCLFTGLTWLALSETTFFVADAGRRVGIPFVGVGAFLYWVAGFMYAAEAVSRLRAVGAAGTVGSKTRSAQ